MTSFTITEDLVNKLKTVIGKGLSNGLGVQKPGQMCVEAAVCYALGLPHGDDPGCVDAAVRTYKIRLNDSDWSSKQARANGLLRLSVLQLGTKGFLDSEAFNTQLAIRTVNMLLPELFTLLDKKKYKQHIKECKAAKTLDAAAHAATAAANAANAAARAAAARAASAAVYAANAAAYAAYAAANAANVANAADKMLLLSAKIAEDILIEMNVPGVQYLYLLEK